MDGKDPQGEDSGTIDPGLKNLGGDDEAKSTQEHPPQPQRSPSPPVILFSLPFLIVNDLSAIHLIS